MPRDGSGDFTRAVTPPSNGDVADADDYNTEQDDVASALSGSINTAGTKAFGADQSFGGFKATNLGTPTAAGDAVSKSYLEGRIGVSIQGYDATLAAMAAGTTGADVLWYWSGSDTLSTMTLTAAARSILDDATVAAIRTTLGIGTGDSPQLTAIELGHASDTTVTRSAAGEMSVEGVVVRLAGRVSVPIPASAMVPNTTNGAAPGTTETSSAKVMLRTLDFDTATQEAVQFLIPMPKGWDEGTVTFQPVWTASAGSAADSVVWDCAGVALSDDDAADTAFGTAVTSSDALLATGDVHIGPESAAITIAGSPAAEDLVVFRVRRVPASDNLPNDAKLIAIRLNINTNAKNDA